MITIHTWNDVTKQWTTQSGTTTAMAVQPTYKQPYVLVYFDYMKGDEERLEFRFSANEGSIGSDKYFPFLRWLDGTISLRRWIVPNSMKGRFPIEIGFNEESVLIEIELINAITTPGTIEIWLKSGSPRL